MDPSTSEALVEQLRRELSDRALSDAHRCPSWPRYARWLRAHEQDDLAEAIELALAPPRARDHRQQRYYATRRVITQVGGKQPSQLMRLWTGELAWSWWFGPFMLAYIDASPPGADTLRDLLGPLGTFLAPERSLGLAEAVDWLLGMDPKGMVGVPITLPAQHAALYELLSRANAQVYEQLAVPQSALEWVFISDTQAPPPPSGQHAVVTITSAAALAKLHWPSVKAMSTTLVVAPSELLARRLPAAAPTRTWPEPAPDFEARRLALAERRAGLFACLDRELAARTLAEAPSCPSWPVFIDFLLDGGHALLAQWLRAALEDPARAQELGHELTRATFSGDRKRYRYQLHQLWKRRGQHAHWLGPFVLSYFDPRLDEQRGALELQTLLGVHATFLPRERVHTHIDSSWLIHALTPAARPTLAPLPGPNASKIVAGLLAVRGHRHADDTRMLRIAEPGKALIRYPDGQIFTNVGPIAADNEATAVLCCEGPEDVRRHAAAQAKLGEFAHVILLGTRELLAQWPSPAEWIPPWSAA